jgi:hypothetical protein
MPPLTNGIQAVSGTLVIAPVRQVLVVLFRGASTVADIDAIHQASIELARAHPGGIGHLNLVAPGPDSGPIDERVRERLLTMMRDERMALRVSSVVYPGGGFQAAMIRGILSGLVLLSRTTAKIRVHSSVDAAADWLVDTLGPANAPKPLQLSAMMDRLTANGAVPVRAVACELTSPHDTGGSRRGRSGHRARFRLRVRP